MNVSKEEYVKRRHHRQIYQDANGRWSTYIDEENNRTRKLIRKSSYNKLLDYLYQHYKQEEKKNDYSNMTLNRLYPMWIDNKKLHGIAEATILKYNTDWKGHYQNSSIIKKPIKSFTKNELDDWAHKMIRDNNMTRKDYINVSTIIRQMLDYAIELEIIDRNYMHEIRIESRMFKQVRKKPSETQVYSQEELSRIKEVALNDLNNKKLIHKLSPLAVVFMFSTGMRVGEVCALKYEDIVSGYIHVQRTIVRDLHDVKEETKGAEGDRWVPLTKEAERIISKSIEVQKQLGLGKCKYVFSSDGNYLREQIINERLKRYCKTLNIPYRSSHKIRKTYISTLIDGGVNINTIREIVGHRDEKTTLNCYCYDRLARDERRELIDKVLNS